MPVPRPCPECGNDIDLCFCFDHHEGDYFEPGRHINESLYTDKASKKTEDNDGFIDPPFPTISIF